MTLMRSFFVCLVLVGSAAQAASLPFADGAEPPQTNFSNWTSTRVNGANTLTQSTARAWDDRRSLTMTYAGATSSAQAAAVVDFTTITSAFVRFWLFVPTGTAAAMAGGSTLRIVRLGDAPTGAAGTGGAAKVNLVLRKDSSGTVHLRLDYAGLVSTTTYGTALATPITEGTWHYVEFGYQPGASPRVRIFIDDPLTPRLDAAPLDTVPHTLQTCWVGLADAVDAQSPITLSFDNIQVATTQTGTAQSSSQHFNELESGTLLITNTPPGKAATIFSSSNLAVSASSTAAHRGGFGLRVIDSDGQAAAGPGAGESVRITATSGTLYRRFFWRPAATNGLGNRTLATITSTGLGSRAIAEVNVAGNGAVSLGGFNAIPAYLLTSTSSVASTNAWHLIELVVTGLGTTNGTRKLYLDGTLAAQVGNIDWTGVTVDVLLEGQTYSSDRTFQGIDDFDDLRVSRVVMPSRLQVTAPAMADGECSAAIVIEARDSDGTARGVVEQITAALSSSGVTGTFYSDVGCTTAITNTTLLVGTGSATVYFRPSNAGTATIAATHLDYLSSPATALVASLAAQLGVVGTGQTVIAGACSSLTIAQSLDAEGAPATVAVATAVSLASDSSTMAYFSDSSCATPITSVVIAAGQSTAGFYFRDTTSGMPMVTVSATGLTSGSQTQTINAAAPSKLVFITPARTVVAAECSAVVTVQSQDTYGNPSPVTSNKQVTFSSSSTGATFFGTAVCGSSGATASMVSGSTTVDIYFKDTKAGGPTLTATAAGFLNGTQVQTITAAAAARLTISTNPQTITAGACSGLTTVQAQDAFGNNTAVTADTALTFSSVPATVTFYSAAGCTGPVTSLTITAATQTRSFYFISSAAGSVTLTVASAPLTPATQVETITASGPTRLVFISGAQNVAAGSCSSAGLIQAQDSFGNPANVATNTVVTLTSTSTSLIFSPTGACGSSVTTVTIAAGTDTTALYFKDIKAGSPTLTATSGALSPANQTETIRPAPPSQLGFKTAAQVAIAGDCSGAITVEARDGFGNPSVVVSNTAVNLATTSAQGLFYSNATCTTSVTQSIIAAGTSGTTFHYRDTRVGAKTLTASNPGLSAPTQGVTIDAAPPAKLVFISPPQTLTAGNCSAVTTVQVRDAFDNVSPVLAVTTVDLTSSSTTMGFDANAACTATVSSVALPANSSQVSFYFNDPTAGAPSLIASVGGLADGAQTATINIGAAAKLAFITPPRTVVAGACSAALTVQSQDVTGNAVPFAASTAIAYSTSSATGALYANASCTTVATQVTVPAGSSSGSLYFKDTKTGPWGVTATAAGLSPASQTVSVAAAPPVVLTILTPEQTIEAGSCSAALTVELYDALGNPASSTSGTSVGLSSTAPSTQFFLTSTCSGAVTSAVIPIGSSKLTLYFKDPKVGAPDLTMTVTGLPPAVQKATFFVGAPAKLAFTTPAQTVSVGTCSAIASIELQDAVGNPSPRPSATAITLGSSSSGGTFYSDATCTTSISGLSFAAGVTAGSFHFQDTALGTPTLSAGSTMLISATQQETIVTPGAPAALVFATPPRTQDASACSQVLLVEVKDQNGNSSPMAAATELTLAATASTVTFHADGTCGAALTKVTIAAGEYRARFHFRDAAAHKVTLTASEATVTPASQEQITTCPLAIDGAACDDQDLCNGRETCVGGACTPAASPLSCDDAENCTTDTCAAATGCAHDVIAGCCRAPTIAPANLAAAVGVRYRIGPGGRTSLIKGTGPTLWTACDSPPQGFQIDGTTGQVDWVPLTAGPQAICLKASGTCGEDTSRFTVVVQATAPAAPIAVLSLAPDQLKTGASTFGDAKASTGTPPLTFEWAWGDGSAPSFGSTASHAFAIAGSYLAKVRVYDQVGQSAEASHLVTVTGPGCTTPPVAKISADALTGEGSLTTAFKAELTASAIYWWDFGDGASAYGAESSHTFSPGAYRVRLQVSAGGCTSEDAVEVRVTSAGKQPPTCSLAVEPSGGAAPLRVLFISTFGGTQGAVVSASMTFSDGLSADAMKYDGLVSRTLTTPGTIEATLVVTDTAGLACRAAVGARATSVGGLTPPEIVSVPQAAGRCGEGYLYNADSRPIAVGSAPIKWSLGKNSAGAGAPAGMTIDEATGQLTWTPDDKTSGPTRVTVVAQNEAGAAEQDFLVEVECAKAKGCGCGSSDLGPLLFGAFAALLMVRRKRRAI